MYHVCDTEANLCCVWLVRLAFLYHVCDTKANLCCVWLVRLALGYLIYSDEKGAISKSTVSDRMQS